MGAQFESTLDPDSATSDFKVLYQRTLIIDYSDGGELAKELRGTNLEESFTINSPHDGLDSLADIINVNILDDRSSARVSDLILEYKIKLTGGTDRANVDYRVVIKGQISDYRIGERGVEDRQLIDLGWRGISTYEPITINGIEVNLPISTIKTHLPNVYEMIRGTEVDTLLSEPLMDGSGILRQPLTNWHFLFDPTGINIDASQYGLDDSLTGVVISSFTMGESNLREGIIEPIEKIASINLDEMYSFKTIQAADSANLDILGFASIDRLDDLEIAGVTPKKKDSGSSTGKFPASIVYGMAGMAAIGGVIFFIISGRKLKKEEGQEQTGIDPSRLTGYQTSASAGGYQTNRGEAQLSETNAYEQHQNVYNEENSKDLPLQETQTDATCGCRTSSQMGSDCDCVMQDSCLCDGTCDCNAPLCKKSTETMK
ncbi:MAG: putative exported protein [Cenarchaeum symbiont of Oopsacas minuta]|nr:putative exported protein [Cenarchaeum symbiont of Oopsacas minuta]